MRPLFLLVMLAWCFAITAVAADIKADLDVEATGGSRNASPEDNNDLADGEAVPNKAVTPPYKEEQTYDTEQVHATTAPEEPVAEVSGI